MPAQLVQWDLDNFDRLIDGEADHFSANLVRLIKRADGENRLLLMAAFPSHVAVTQIWEAVAPCRMWICTECGFINIRRHGEAISPCLACKNGKEPPLPANARTE